MQPARARVANNAPGRSTACRESPRPVLGTATEVIRLTTSPPTCRRSMKATVRLWSEHGEMVRKRSQHACGSGNDGVGLSPAFHCMRRTERWCDIRAIASCCQLPRAPPLRSSPRPIRPAIPIATLTLESSRQAADITPAMTMPWRECSAPCRQRHDKRKTPPFGSVLLESGAGNETRTRDLNLGKVALYQLSYSRRFRSTCVKGALLCRYCCTASTGIFT